MLTSRMRGFSVKAAISSRQAQCATLAQLVEHSFRKAGVQGSSP